MLTFIVFWEFAIGFPVIPYIIAGLVGGWLIEERLRGILLAFGVGFLVFIVGLGWTSLASATSGVVLSLIIVFLNVTFLVLAVIAGMMLSEDNGADLSSPRERY